MGYSNKLRSLFPDIQLHPEDLLLLEAFQINYLPERVPPGEFATLLATYPVLHRFLVAPLALTVYAVEPVTSLRSFMKEKASKANAENVFVMDGTLDSIPLPDDSPDVLITSNAIGWNLPQELKEIEGIVRAGGQAIHLLWSNEAQENPFHETLTSAPWSYSCLQNQSQNDIKIIYRKPL